MVSARKRATASIAALLASLFMLVGFAQGASAATSPAKSPSAPACTRYWGYEPNPAQCRAREVWHDLNRSIANAAKEKDQAKRLVILTRAYWIVAAPLANSQPNPSNAAFFIDGFEKSGPSVLQKRAESIGGSVKTLTYLRDFVATNQKNLAQMNASVEVMEFIAKNGSPLLKPFTKSFVKKMGVPFLKDRYTKLAADDFLRAFLRAQTS